MSGPAQVRLEPLALDGAVAARLVIEAPGRGNSLDAAMLEELEAHLLGLDFDPDRGVRVVLLEGAGERSFSTGYHVPSLLAELAEGPSVSDFERHPLERALRALEAVPVPTVAVVGGNAYGAGCELALTCDLRVASECARLCMPPAKLGVLYSATGIRRLLELVGPALTQELLFTGSVIGAERALAVGLLNRVVPRSELATASRELATRIAGNAPLSLRHTKAIVARLRPPELDAETLAWVATLRDECFRSDEFRKRTATLAAKGGAAPPDPSRR